MATIDNAAQRMTRLLDQLRLGAAAAMRRPLRLHDLIEVALARCAANTPVPVLSSQAPDVVVEADQEHLTSVIEHVVRNAQDATPSDGQVRVEVSRKAALVTIAVRDTGRGMEADFVRDRLFGPSIRPKGPPAWASGRIRHANTCARWEATSMCKAVPGRERVLRLPCRLLLRRTDNGGR